MSSSYKARGIILRRRNYGEADKIYTILTPSGKVSAIAKGVRRLKARLASHLELFAEIDLMLAKGKNLDVVISARVKQHYDLTHDYELLRRGFLFLEMSDKLSDTQDTGDLFACVQDGLEALEVYSPIVTELAFKLKLLQLLGHAPQLDTVSGTTASIRAGQAYAFDLVQGGLTAGNQAGINTLSTDSLKLWRACLRYDIIDAAKIKGAEGPAADSLLICDRFYEYLFDKRFVSAEI